MRRFGVNRILLANELVEPAALRWIGRELEGDDDVLIYCLVDSVAIAALIDRALDGTMDRRRLPVMVEVGAAGQGPAFVPARRRSWWPRPFARRAISAWPGWRPTKAWRERAARATSPTRWTR